MMIEENIEFYLPSTKKIVDKSMEAFYNPEMKFSRDTTIALLKSWDKNHLRVGLPLAGSGIRGIRILKELDKNKIDYVFCNDHDKETYKVLQKNQELLHDKRFFISCEEADEFLLYRKGFDYIDLDPYGSPNPYLDASIKRISNFGVLAITCTDVKSLAGSAKKAGLRKYGVIPEPGNHVQGLKTLIRKCQAVGAQYDKALIPILSYSYKHYYRIYFDVRKGKQIVDDLLVSQAKLHSVKAKEMLDLLPQTALVKRLKEEVNADITGENHYCVHDICQKYGLKQVPKNLEIKERLEKNGFSFCNSHVKPTCFWSNVKEKKLLAIIQ